MTRFRWVLLACLLSAAVLTVLARAQRPPRHIKIATVLNESHPSGQALRFFKERLEALSGGELRVDVFFNSQLGSANEALELCRLRDLEMTYVSTSELSVYLPNANALAMPFIWRDGDHQKRVLAGEVGSIIRDEAQAVGFNILGFWDAGTRNVTSTRGPIEHPDDLRNMRIRIMGTPIMNATVNRFGATAVALNMGEVYTALQTGVIDGWENNPMTIVDYRMYETGCIHFSWTRHFSIPDLLVASDAFMDALPEQHRAWVKQTATETQAFQHALWEDSQRKALQTMREEGMVITEPDGQEFRQRVLPLYEAYYERYGPKFQALCEMILEAP